MEDKKEKLGMEKFDWFSERIHALAKESKELVLDDFKDKETLALIKASRITLKNFRIDLSKAGKSIREEAVRVQKEVIFKEKELIAIIEPEEKRLKEIEDDAKDKAEREKRLEILPERKERLSAIGNSDGDFEITDNDILGMDDSSFEIYYSGRVVYKAEKEREAIDEEKRKVEEEKEKMEIEKQTRLREENARQEERERLEREKKDEIERKERDAKLEEERKIEEAKKLEADKKYQKFLKDNGYTEKTRDDFNILTEGNTVILYKKVATFEK